MTRMTNDMRDEILRRALRSAFDPRDNDIAAREDALCRAAYATCYSAAEIAQVSALPTYWTRLDPCLRFIVDGARITLRTSDNHLPVPYHDRRTGTDSYGCHSAHGVIVGELAANIMALMADKEALRVERDRAKANLSALLSRIQTVKKLAEAWPEGRDFYADFMAEKPALPPAIRFDEVNAALGLIEARAA